MYGLRLDVSIILRHETQKSLRESAKRKEDGLSGFSVLFRLITSLVKNRNRDV